MATRTPEIIHPGKEGMEHAVLVTWSGLLNTDTGVPVSLTDFPDRTIQLTGTFGSGGEVTFQGSNNGTDYVVLTDPQGNALTMTAGRIEVVTETPRYVRPSVTGGDGTTNLTLIMFARTPR